MTGTIWVFTPSRTDPKDLEYIFVQRQALLQDAVERVGESALTHHKHHQLFVGPRGTGKAHLITLIVHRLSQSEELKDRLRIAWLNEDESCSSVLDLLLKVHSALEKRYPTEYRQETIDPAYEMDARIAKDFIAKHLVKSLGTRTLLIVAENLDAIFEGLRDSGQKELRAFIQENPQLTIVASAQRLAVDLSSRKSPFFGFFQTEHLKPLEVGEATELLKNIARLKKNDSVIEFLSTPKGRSRVRAIHHLSGGNHRIYVVLSQFISNRTIDALVEPFLKMVDELTPYYQERLRCLPPLQRKIVEFLCSCELTAAVKTIAKRLFTPSQTISSQLQDLRQKGYVESHQRGRESLYDVREPLMRLSIEVKDNNYSQPLRLLVDFLRVWYDQPEIQQRLDDPSFIGTCRDYLESAKERNLIEGNLRKKIFLQELLSVLPVQTPSGLRHDLAKSFEDFPEALTLALHSICEKNYLEALLHLDELISATADPSKRAALRLLRGNALLWNGNFAESLSELAIVIGTPDSDTGLVIDALTSQGEAYTRIERHELAIASYSSAIKMTDTSHAELPNTLMARGRLYFKLEKYENAIADYTDAIERLGDKQNEIVGALFHRGNALLQNHELPKAITDFTCVIESPLATAILTTGSLFCRGLARSLADEHPLAILDYTSVIERDQSLLPTISHQAYYFRGLEHFLAGQTSLAIADFTVATNSNTIRPNLSSALYYRGYCYLLEDERELAKKDFEHLLQHKYAEPNTVEKVAIKLAELHWLDEQWTKGFDALETGLNFRDAPTSSHHRSISSLIGFLFAAGLTLKGRKAKIQKLVKIYRNCKLLSVLGEGAVRHLGEIYLSGSPFPSDDNLEQWFGVWESVTAGWEEFQLPLRLLRTGIDFIKSDGNDPGVLLLLTSTERKLLEQAFGVSPLDRNFA